MAALATAFVRVLSDTDLKPGVVAGAQKAGIAGGATASKGFRGAFVGGLKGLAGPLAAIFGAKAIGGFFKDAVGGASDLSESINAVNVTFGEASKGVLKLSKNAATGVGLSRAEFNALSVQFSAFAKTIAGEGGNVTGTIDDITKRAADFASVMNLDVAQAATLFQSGLAGETEPLRRFGIDLSAASVQAFAYANGIAKSGEELTEAQKVQARYGSLLEQTSQTQGDFANTSEGLANQQRILGARWDNLKAKLGQALLPAVTAVVSKFNDFLPVLLNIGRNVGSVLGPAFGFLKQLLGPFVPIIQQLGQQFGAVLGPAMQRIGGLVTGVLMPSFSAFFELIRPILEFLIRTIGGALIGAFKGAVKVIQGVLTAISGLLDVFVGVFTGNWTKAWNGVKKIGSGIWTAIKGAFQVFINVGILRLLRVGLSLVRGVWSSVWSSIRGFLSSIWSSIRSLVSSGLSRLRSSVSSGLRRVLGFFRDLPGNIISALGNLGSLLFNIGRDMIQGLINGLKSLGGAAVDAAKNIGSGIANGVKGILGIGSPSKVFAEIGMDSTAGFIQGLQRGARDLERVTAGLTGGLVSSAAAPTSSSAGMPRELAVRDFDGSLIGRMRVEADRVARIHEQSFADRLAMSGTS